MSKMMTNSQRRYIEDLAEQAGKNDPGYYVHERLGISRSMNPQKKITMSEASRLIDELLAELR